MCQRLITVQVNTFSPVWTPLEIDKQRERERERERENIHPNLHEVKQVLSCCQPTPIFVGISMTHFITQQYTEASKQSYAEMLPIDCIKSTL